VTLGDGANIWHHCVLRGDVAPIRVGRRVNLQDGALLHCKHDVTLEIDDDVAIAHYAVVHCKRVGSNTLIGTRATVLDDCEIGRDCIIAAGTVVAPRTIVPDGSVVMGCPEGGAGDPARGTRVRAVRRGAVSVPGASPHRGRIRARADACGVSPLTSCTRTRPAIIVLSVVVLRGRVPCHSTPPCGRLPTELGSRLPRAIPRVEWRAGCQ